MKVVFAGTPPFARSALEAILAAGFDVPLVLTQPERPAGRGLRPQASAVKQSALEHAIPLAQPRSLRLDGKYPEDAGQARAALEAARPDVLVVAAYGLLLPRWLLELPAHGCLNIHASLLPRWRGAAPIQRAIEAGDAHSGITIMHMDEGLDTGDIALAQPIALEPDETSASLHDKLAALGARLIVEALRQGSQGCLPRQLQDAQQACYAEKIRKDETRVNWGEDARDIARRLRAFTPTPGMAVLHQGRPIKICQARPQDFLWNGMEEALPPEVRAGTVLAADADGLLVACGRGALRITHLQRPGGKRLPVGDFLRGHPLPVGAVLGQDAAATAARPWHMARIEWLSPEEGGRQGGPIPQGSARYRPLAVFPHQRIGQMDARWDVHIVCLHHPAPLRSSVLVQYLADAAPHENFARHDHFAIHEGPRCVGTVWLEKA